MLHVSLLAQEVTPARQAGCYFVVAFSRVETMSVISLSNIDTFGGLLESDLCFSCFCSKSHTPA